MALSDGNDAPNAVLLAASNCNELGDSALAEA